MIGRSGVLSAGDTVWLVADALPGPTPWPLVIPGSWTDDAETISTIPARTTVGRGLGSARSIPNVAGAS